MVSQVLAQSSFVFIFNSTFEGEEQIILPLAFSTANKNLSLKESRQSNNMVSDTN